METKLRLYCVCETSHLQKFLNLWLIFAQPQREESFKTQIKCLILKNIYLFIF